LRDYAALYLIDAFSSVPNVGWIKVGGLRELSVRVWIDPIKLAANNLTIQEVERAFRNENVNLPAGTLETNNTDLTLNNDKSYSNIDSIKQLPLKKDNDKVIILSDVANVELGPLS
jgi:Cation/multidrug efflux pump